MADISDDDFEQSRQRAHQYEAQQIADAQASKGALKVADEQDGYQATIDKQRQQAAPKDEHGLLYNMAAGAIDIVKHPIDDLEEVWNGAVKGASSTLYTAEWAAGQVAKLGANSQDVDGFLKEEKADWNKTAEKMSFADDKDNSSAGFVKGTAEFLFGRRMFTGFGAGNRVANLGSMTAAFNPDDKHATDLFAQIPGLPEKYKAALETHEDDPEWENRLKQFGDAILFEVGTELGSKIVGGLSDWVRGARAARLVAKDAAEEAVTPSTKIDAPAAPAEPTPVGTPQERFMDEYSKLDAANDVHESQKNIGGALVDMSTGPDPEAGHVHLDILRNDTGEKGVGKAALKTLTDLADKHGTTLKLDAVPMDMKDAEGNILRNADGTPQKMPLEKLKEIYRKHGFEDVEGGTTPGQAMERAPVKAAEPAGWKPTDVTATDTANPKQSVENLVEQPKPGEAPAAVFNPNTIAAKMLIPVKSAQEVMEAINSGDYDKLPAMLDDTHRTIPMDDLSTEGNLKGVMNAVEAKIGDVIKAAHGTTVVGAKAITQLARDIGGDRAALSRLYEGVTSEGGLAARVIAGYNMLMASAKQMKALANVAKGVNAQTPEGAQAILAFQKQLAIHSAIVGEIRQASTEIARALYAHRFLKASTDVALHDINDYASTKLGPEAIQKFAAQVANAKNLRQLTNIADATRQRGWKNVLQEIAQNGMLSGPTTQLTNIVGNMSNVALKCMERYLGGVIGEVRGVMFPNADHATLREAWAHTQGAYEGFKQASNLAWQALKDENFTSKFSQPGTRAIAITNEGGGQFLDFSYKEAINATGRVIRYPGRLMGLFDHYSQGIGYYGDLNARSYVQAASEADEQGLKGPLRDAFMDQRKTELFKNPTKELDNKAMAAGRYTAFLEPPQTQTGSAIFKAINSFDPVTKLVVAPFIHRPGNMLRQGFGDYTVAGLAQKNIRAQLAGGGSDADLAMARMVIGSSALVGSTVLAANGLITGARLGPKNTETLDGVTNYSAKIGGSWYKFDRLDPIGTWLAAGADLHEAYAHHYDPNDPDAMNALQTASTAAALAVSHAALDKTFMKSVDMLTQAFGEKDPSKAQALFARAISENVGKLLPFSGLARAAAHGSDDEQRTGGKGSIFDGVIASIPYLSQELPPRRDLLGRPMPAQSAWNPFGAVTGNMDEMDQELSKVAVNVVAPPRNIDGYTLNAHEYDEVLTNGTQAKIFPGGSTLEEYLRALTSSPQWKYNASMQDGMTANGQWVQAAINGAYQSGVDKYKLDHPDLGKKKQDEMFKKFMAETTPKQATPQQAVTQ